MKKIITISLLSIFAITTTTAQVGKGTYLLGASKNVASVGWSDIALTPSVGYFLSDDIAVGLGILISNSNDNTEVIDGNSNSKMSSMDLSPFVRYYMNDMLFVSAGFGMSNMKETTEFETQNDYVETTSSFGLNIGAGLSLMWGERVAIEPAFMIGTGTSNTKYSYDPMDPSQSKPDENGASTMNAGFQIGLSLRM